jgi:hypothetical protein
VSHVGSTATPTDVRVPACCSRRFAMAFLDAPRANQMLIAFAAQSTARHTVQKFSKALENILIVLRALFVNFTKTGSGIAATFSASAIFAPHYGYSSCPNVTKRFQIRHTVSGVPCNDRRTQVGFLGLRESCCGRSCPEATSKNMSKRMCSCKQCTAS